MEITCLDAMVFEMMLSRARLLAQKVKENSGLNKMGTLHEWKNSEEACAILHIKPRTLQSLRVSGKLPYSRIERKIYYHSDDILKLIGDKQSQLNNNNL